MLAVEVVTSIRRHPQARLSVEDVLVIRSSTETERALAARFGVHPSTIHRARTGEGWSEAIEQATPAAVALAPGKAEVLSVDELAELLEKLA